MYVFFIRYSSSLYGNVHRHSCIPGEGVPNKNFTHAWLAKNGAADAFAAKYASFLAELDKEFESKFEQPPVKKTAMA